MSVTRRTVLKGLSALSVTAVTPGLSSATLAHATESGSGAPGLPVKSDFAIADGITYLNSAYTHPMPTAAQQAAQEWAEFRAHPEVISRPKPLADVKAEFAALINAKPSEISFVQSTSAGENLVVNGLGIPFTKGNVVTDALHFEGALLHLQALRKNNGLDLRIVKPKDWRIDLKDLEHAIDKNTKLVEISLVAMNNGFQHDLKAVCDLAHSVGAYVYADVAQAAGCTPIDVRASGLDFCACSSFKWLMADFGLGFLFTKEELLDRVIHRTDYGYYQAQSLDSHFMPGDTPAGTPYTWELSPDASGHFETGTHAIGVAHVLAQCLPYIRKLAVTNIEAHRQPLLQRLHQEMPRLGFDPLTPPESKSALITFAVKARDQVLKRLTAAKINARLGAHFIRLSPSVFNDMNDIEHLLQALS